MTDHDEGRQDMRDVPLPGLHEVEVGGIVLFIHEQPVHADDPCGKGDHGQPGFPGLLLVAHIQLREQLLCKALHRHDRVRMGVQGEGGRGRQWGGQWGKRRRGREGREGQGKGRDEKGEDGGKRGGKGGHGEGEGEGQAKGLREGKQGPGLDFEQETRRHACSSVCV